MKPTNEQIESIQYAADWLSRSEDIGNQKHAERLIALLASSALDLSAEQELEQFEAKFGAEPSERFALYAYRQAWRAWQVRAALNTPADDEEASRKVITVCCGRSDCGGECEREWQGMEPVRAAPTTPSAPADDSGPVFPAELTPPVRRILGMMLWETTPIAGALRAAGRDIPRCVEDEQAAALHWLLGFALEHGMDWHKPAAAALHKMTQGIKD